MMVHVTLVTQECSADKANPALAETGGIDENGRELS
jgi:hypothetical protein